MARLKEVGWYSLRKREQHPFKSLHKYYKIRGIAVFIPEGKKRKFISPSKLSSLLFLQNFIPSLLTVYTKHRKKRQELIKINWTIWARTKKQTPKGVPELSIKDELFLI